MHNASDFFDPIIHWAIRKSFCDTCFSFDQPTPRAVLTERATTILWRVFHKTSSDRPSSPLYSFLKRIVDDRLSDRTVCGTGAQISEMWQTIEDRNYLNHPDLITTETLEQGGIPVHLLPDFGLIDPHTDRHMRRCMQFLVDYFGVFRTFQLNTAGILQPLLSFVHQATFGHDATGFSRPLFLSELNKRLMLETLVRMKPALNYTTTLDVIMEDYFPLWSEDQRHHLRMDVTDAVTEYST